MKTHTHLYFKAQTMMEYILVMVVIVVGVFLAFKSGGGGVLERLNSQTVQYFDTGATALTGGYYNGTSVVRVDPNKIDGGWCEWTSCVNGYQSRECACPRPAFGGAACADIEGWGAVRPGDCGGEGYPDGSCYNNTDDYGILKDDGCFLVVGNSVDKTYVLNGESLGECKRQDGWIGECRYTCNNGSFEWDPVTEAENSGCRKADNCNDFTTTGDCIFPGVPVVADGGTARGVCSYDATVPCEYKCNDSDLEAVTPCVPAGCNQAADGTKYEIGNCLISTTVSHNSFVTGVCADPDASDVNCSYKCINGVFLFDNSSQTYNNCPSDS
jgi:hypothetical protein